MTCILDLLLLLLLLLLVLLLHVYAGSPGQLTSNQELKRLFEGDEDIKSGFHAVAKLAWGVMICITGDDNNQTHSKE